MEMQTSWLTLALGGALLAVSASQWPAAAPAQEKRMSATFYQASREDTRRPAKPPIPIRDASASRGAETPDGTVALAALDGVRDLAATRDAVAIGPGLGLVAETQELVRRLTRDVAGPMALDADALTALAGHLEILREASGPRCLTPHPGEMARMLGVSTEDVQRDRIEVTRRYEIPADLIPADASVEMEAKKAAGYFADSTGVLSSDDLEKIRGRGLHE